MAINPVV